MRLAFFAATCVASAALASAASAQTQPVIGLITKTETNPFFVKMKEGAAEAAKAKGAKLLTGAGKADGDNAGQVTAMENMIAAGAKTILITPSDSKAIVPAIRKARDKGVLVIALDSPTDPADATDALFAKVQPARLIHCAAFVEEWGTRDQFWQANVEGTAQLLASAKAAGVKPSF